MLELSKALNMLLGYLIGASLGQMSFISSMGAFMLMEGGI